MKLTVRHETVAHAGMAGRLRIAHLSDLHLWWGTKKLQKIDHLLATWQPEVIALTGDYADTPGASSSISTWVQRLTEKYPVFWIAGNHDTWWHGQMVAALTRISTAHAVDERPAKFVAADGAVWEFLSWAQHCSRKPCATVRRIVLIHDPSGISAPQTAGADLLLAGHLHGGQFVFWKNSQGLHLPPGWLYPWCGDRWELGSGTTLIVSRGLGDTLPLRFRCPRELVVVDLEPTSTGTHDGSKTPGESSRSR